MDQEHSFNQSTSQAAFQNMPANVDASVYIFFGASLRCRATDWNYKITTRKMTIVVLTFYDFAR